MTLFDEPEAAQPEMPTLTEPQAKAKGMAIAADSKRTVLDQLRDAVRRKYLDLVRSGVRSYVTADDGRELFETMLANGHFERPHSMNFMGSLFAGSEWEFTGERIKSKTAGSHANELKCWRYVG